MSAPSTRKPLLSELLPPLILGGGVYNTQMNATPHSLPVRALVARAFALGINAVDTSPYYGPSELILGDALHQPEITRHYSRSRYLIMTKAGRKSLDEFDYTPSWIRSSVERSITRLCPEGRYIDVVFLHDIEFVTLPEVLAAFGTLVQLVAEGKVRYIGISGYPPATLLGAAIAIKDRFGRPVDIVQSYGHANLQNTALIEEGWLRRFREEAGVDVTLNASPLNMKLLSGVEPGAFHPAPRDLIERCLEAARICKQRSTSLPQVAMRYALGRWLAEARWNGSGSTVTGASYVEELEENVAALRDVTEAGEGIGVRRYTKLSGKRWSELRAEAEEIQKVLGKWLGYEWKSPPEDWFDRRKSVTPKL